MIRINESKTQNDYIVGSPCDFGCCSFISILSSSNIGELKSNGTTIAPKNTAVARVSYGRFLEYIKSGRVISVDIFDGGRNAVVETIDSDLDNKVQRLRVDLPGLTPELINNLKMKV